MPIKLNTASSGSVTLDAANTASNFTISVPAITATMATLTTPAFVSTIGVGGATPANSGAGITFPSTASASTDPNTLDDYEEGTWTPTASGTSTAGSATYTTRIGKYTKIGNTVTVMCSLGWSAHTGTGDITVSGLPFTSANYSSNAIWAAGVYANDMNFGTLATQLAVFVVEADTLLTFRGMINNSNRANVPLDTSVGNLVINLTYYV